MYKVHILFALIIISGVNVFAKKNYSVGSIRTFNNVELAIPTAEEPNIIPPEDFIDADEILKLEAVKKKVVNLKKFVDKLDSATFISLPIGISYGADPKSEDPNLCIIIDEATIYPQYAEFSAYMSVKNPLDGQIISFRAKNIKFTFKGGLLNGFKLELMSKIKTKLSKESYLFWNKGSFVDWDCKGFKSIAVNATVQLNEKKYVKVNPLTGKEIGKVEQDFFITCSGLNDLVVQLSIDPFMIKGFEEAYFSFKNAVLDFSDTRNAANFSLPANYPGDFSGDKVNLWRGFYIEEAHVYLSKKFNEKSGKVTDFYAKKLLLDDYGLTANIGVTNLLSYENGQLGSWKMALNNFELSFFAGDFKNMGLKGGVLVDGIDKPMLFSAFYDVEGNYHFGISPGRDLPFKVFSADITLFGTSKINVDVEQGKFNAAALLDGEIRFKASKKKSEGKKVFNTPYVKFEGLRIATKAPHFDVKAVEFVSNSGKSDFNKFPITISNIGFAKTPDSKAIFSFDLGVNIAPSDDLGIVAYGRIGLKASGQSGTWKYDGLTLSKLEVEQTIPKTLKIKGGIAFADADETYGDGFRGEAAVSLVDKFDIEAVIVFGVINGMRYFFVDGFYTSPAGIPAAPFIINGFGGGVFYRMRQSKSPYGGSDFGKSLSGITYVPDKTISIGIKAGIKGGVVSENVIDARLNFEVAFTTSFGIALIGFDGEANMLQAPAGINAEQMKSLTKSSVGGEKQKVPESPMKVRLAMRMDFQNNEFHAEMDLFLNIANALKGIGENNRAGWGVIHIGSDKWYLHLGTPTDPVGVNFIGLMEVSAYFMAGHEIPDAMMMNQRVLEILDMEQSDFNGERKDGELTTGKGLAFGAHFSIDTGDLTFLIFYARFEMGGGFDVMLLDNGPNAFCKGGTSSPGINGWYAKGQAYAYFGGKIGIKVKVFGRKKKYDIINLQAAVAIRMEGPNPTWMKGVVGGKYKLLGGMIKGTCKFEVEVGEKCDMRTVGDLSDLEIIADLTPAKDSKDVDVFTIPQAVFNMPVDKVLEISEDPDLKKVFKINLVEYSLYAEDGSIYPGEIEWNEDKTTLGYRMDEIFYSNSTYKVVAKISFDEEVEGNWQQYKGEDGKVYYETKEAVFKTGDLPKKIPEDAIRYTYPVDRMVNFYKNEYNKAYVAFSPGVAAFFENTEGYRQEARWTKVNSQPLSSKLKYNKNTRTVEVEIPSNLTNDGIYRFDLVHVPLNEDNSLDRNVVENTKQTMNESDGNSTEIVTREAQGAISEGDIIDFYGLDFRCSKYDKFLDKWNKDELNVGFRASIAPAIEYPCVIVNNEELFDINEIKGSSKNFPLIRIEAVLESSDWYKGTYGKMIYDNYPIHPKAIISNRSISVNSNIPPVKPIWIYQSGEDISINDLDIENSTFVFDDNRYDIYYGLPSVWANDYLSIRNKLVNLLDKGIIAETIPVKYIVKTYPWPQLGKGNYPIKVSYQLPGINKITSAKVLNIKNNFENTQFNIFD